MLRQILTTADGSHTISIPEMNVTYHSHHGALSESIWVFIDAGLLPLINRNTYDTIHILEIGFGTGLNALLSLQQARLHKQKIHYTAIEPFPLTPEEFTQLNHGKLLSLEPEFLQLHTSPWEKTIIIDPFFSLEKRNQSLRHLSNINNVDCIYFDAFAPTHQPELWTMPVFETLFNALSPGGVLVTYSSKSDMRRAMLAAGFTIQKIPGPHGKREMVRSRKAISS